MGMGRRKHRQDTWWVATAELWRTAGHVFYERVNRILNATAFGRATVAPDLLFHACRRHYPGGLPQTLRSSSPENFGLP